MFDKKELEILHSVLVKLTFPIGQSENMKAIETILIKIEKGLSNESN